MPKKITKPAAVPNGGDNNRQIIYETVYHNLYNAIITGRLAPGLNLSVRGLAEEMGVSPMPVREAVRRLVALGALEIHNTRRVSVSAMTKERFDQICTARTMLEPELAARALDHLTRTDIRAMVAIDDEIEVAMQKGDPDLYSLKNWEFHFTLYRAAGAPILLGLVESLWLRFGPFMRVVVGRLGTGYLTDQHTKALEAIGVGDIAALREAIRLDIYDGMEVIGKEVLGVSLPRPQGQKKDSS